MNSKERHELRYQRRKKLREEQQCDEYDRKRRMEAERERRIREYKR